MKDTAVLFKTTVLITDKGTVVVDHESLPSNEVTKRLGKGYYPSLINAIVSVMLDNSCREYLQT